MTSRSLLGFARVIVTVFGGSMLVSLPATASDKLCTQLRAFETAPFESGHDGRPIRRTVTFLWKPPKPEELYAWACTRSISDPWAIGLCNYLMNNTSLEFRDSLPIRALSCYGYKFPKFASYDWNDWTATINLPGELSGHSTNRSMIMDIDLNNRDAPNSAVRISAIPDKPSVDDKAEPALDLHPSQSTDPASRSNR